MELANRILDRLLSGGERALVQGGNGPRAEKLKVDHAYWKMPLHQRDAFHVRMKQAENAGAVALEWSRYGGEDQPLAAIRLADAKRLAIFLGKMTYEQRMHSAETLLSSLCSSIPILEEMLNRWRTMKTIRGFGPDSAPVFSDAARVLMRMSNSNEEEVVRVVSRELFKDSKRIEALVSSLDILTSDSLNAMPRHAEEVLSGIGLRKEPIPFMLAGAGSVMLEVSGEREIAFPYLAVSPAEVIGHRGDLKWVLIIENLTTFHLAARARPELTDGLVLYSGGMPSPSWRRALRALIDKVPHASVLHFGDIDAGGFRIAACIAQTLAPRQLLPWMMDPTKVACDPAEIDERKSMEQSARRAGWADLASLIASAEPGTLEQEDIPIILPTAVLS